MSRNDTNILHASTANNTIPENLYNFAITQAGYGFYTRLENFSRFLLGTAYGSPEIPKREFASLEILRNTLAYEPEFTYTFNKLDCVTYVETAMALAYVAPENFSSTITFKKSFEKNLKSIRYIDGIDTYVFRNHITSLDWCNNNADLFSEQTESINPANNNLVATANINKGLFFYKTQIEKEFPAADQDTWYANLNKIVPNFGATTVNFPYLDTNTFLNVDNYAAIVKSFPHTSVVQIVRPGWDLAKNIGTQLNVSHQGLVFKTTNENGIQDLKFLHATSVGTKQVVEIRLYDYLLQYTDQNKTTVRGINIQAITADNIQAHLNQQAEHHAALIEQSPIKNYTSFSGLAPDCR